MSQSKKEADKKNLDDLYSATRTSLVAIEDNTRYKLKPVSFSGHYLGFSLQVGWRQEVLLKLKDRTSLKFELFDYVLLETSEGVASMSRQLVNSFSLSSRNLLDVKRKSPVCVQFKLKPSTASSLHSQLGIHFQEDFGSKLICTFSEKILTAFLEELEISRFSRKIKYGFLGLRSKWVPY